jgi:peptidoglycan/LPS O-acetylase OafA/YrhL
MIQWASRGISMTVLRPEGAGASSFGTPTGSAAATSIGDIPAHPYRTLGAYRFFLASLVLFSHAGIFLPEGVASLHLGNVAVMLFFVVSGFVIFEALDIFYRRSTVKFLLNRALKIYPAYWVALPIAYAARLWSGETVSTEPFAVFINVSLLLAYFPQSNAALVISFAWAVITECQFYILAAAVWFVAQRLPRAPILLLVSLLSLAAYIWIWWTEAHNRFYGAFYFSPFFILGGAGYFLMTRRDARLIVLVAIAGCLSVHSFFFYNARGLQIGSSTSDVVLSTVIFVALACVMGLLVAVRIPEWWERVDKRLGDYTYALYLIQSAAIDAVVAIHLDRLTSFALVVPLSLALAVLIHMTAERPIIWLRNKLRGRDLYR